jgi:hypothetical protein
VTVSAKPAPAVPRRHLRLAVCAFIVGAALSLAGPLSGASAHAAGRAYRAFSDSSFWNRPLPRGAPVRKSSDEMIAYLRRDNTTNYISLSGTERSGEWGMPIYWAKPGDPEYSIHNNCTTGQPPEYRSVRIPRGARPDPTTDAAMTVYDRDRGRVFGLWHARYDRQTDTWSSCGGTVYYLRSNGLHGKLRRSNEPRNTGHRGVPPPTWAVRYGEVKAGAIRHVLKIGVNTTRCQHVFPMVEDECGTWAEHAPPEGTRIRIKPGVHLRRLHLSRGARVVARALKRYGAIIGDQSGGPISLKVANTVAQNGQWMWKGVLNSHSLARVPLRLFEVVR